MVMTVKSTLIYIMYFLVYKTFAEFFGEIVLQQSPEQLKKLGTCFKMCKHQAIKNKNSSIQTLAYVDNHRWSCSAAQHTPPQ